MVTLGVSDLARARAFYEALGWRGQTVDDTVFFQAGGMAVVLWGQAALAADAGLPAATGATPFAGAALAHNVRSRDEVDAILAAAAEAGGTITSPPAPTFYGGYAGYLADPDGHLWEVAHNPGFRLEDDGSLVLPDFSAG